jgi:hypothetical protein
VRQSQCSQVWLHAVAVNGDTHEPSVQERLDRFAGDDALDQSAAGVSGLAAALYEQKLAGLTSQLSTGRKIRMPGDGSAIVEIGMFAHRGLPYVFLID